MVKSMFYIFLRVTNKVAHTKNPMEVIVIECHTFLLPFLYCDSALANPVSGWDHISWNQALTYCNYKTQACPSHSPGESNVFAADYLLIYIYGLIQCFNIFWLIHLISISKCYYDISGIYLIHLHFWNSRFAAKFHLIQFPWSQIDLGAARRRSCNCWSLPERLLISIASRFQGFELGEFSGLPSTSHNAWHMLCFFLGWIDGQRHSMKFVFLVAETKKYVKK
jgi:hypothetical protein